MSVDTAFYLSYIRACAQFRRGMSVDTAYLLLRYIFHFTYDKGERRKINVAS